MAQLLHSTIHIPIHSAIAPLAIGTTLACDIAGIDFAYARLLVQSLHSVWCGFVSENWHETCNNLFHYISHHTISIISTYHIIQLTYSLSIALRLDSKSVKS